MTRMLFRGLAAAVSAGLALLLAACASSPDSPGPPASSALPPDTAAVPPDTAAVPLYVPEQTERAFFSFGDGSILRDLETGSPASLRSAASKLRKSAASYTQAERVALSVASSVMSIVWPSERSGIEVPPGTLEANPYTAAIESARIGIYDENTGNSDFFTLVLPSLVLVTSPSSMTDEFRRLSHDSLTAALGMNAESVLARYLLGRLYLLMDDGDAAVAMLAEAAELAPDCLEVRYELARAYFGLGRSEEAFGLAEFLLDEHPRNVPLLKLCTEIALSNDDFALAEQYIAQVLQQEPDNSLYLLRRIRVLVEQGNFIKAVPLLDVYARGDRTSRDYLLLRSRVQQEWNKNSAAAAATLEEAMMLYPDDLDVTLAAAELASASGGVVRGKGAGQLAQEVLLRDPDNLRALEICTEDAVRRRDWRNAYGYSSVLLGRKGRSKDVAIPHVTICLGLGRLDEAMELAAALYAEDPAADDVREAYIRAVAASGGRTEALSMIQSLLPGSSPGLRSFLYYQRSLLAAGDQERLSDLRQSLTANPRNQEPLFELYRYYFSKKDYRKAQYYLKQVVALNPSDEEMLRLNSELDALLD